MSAYKRAVFVASHPAAAAKAFDIVIRGFIDIVVKYNRGVGLFGKCSSYYGTVEAQGRGTLHCHMLLWVEGHPNPERLRSMMIDDKNFGASLFGWLEDLIKCELPGTSPDGIGPTEPEPAKPVRQDDELDPCLRQSPQIAELGKETFLEAFNDFVRSLAIECNWHEHTLTCFKHLRPGEEPRDQNCRMRIDGTVRTQSCLDPEMQSILLRRLHLRINNYNDITLFLLQCNMDIKFIGSGAAAKALTYYVSDYITKNNLQVHVGLQAIHAAIDSHQKHFMDDVESSASVHKRNLLTKTVNAMMEAFDAYHFSDTTSWTISNFLIELECKDAKDVVRGDYNRKGFQIRNPCEYDVDLLKEALILDSALDCAMESDVQILDDDVSNDHRNFVLPQDKQDIITISHELHCQEHLNEHSDKIEGLVIEVSPDMEDQITQHNTYMNAQ
ncbi:hypothetical protein M404DRAFT_33317 [Pisolithus tinctorius Marx 270]|uniref:Helitron helicase-like domain-containing protein n=1 Tax=Pisolithus tinctorius Marx 270 TaxID=870435 RepID=A0A0C3JFN7_PISTI|nr:hypothetical protein M404DRAFT_33317 [Pisolithus tinctorius Marx 270]